MNATKAALLAILEETSKYKPHRAISATRRPDGSFVIRYGAMYDAPSLNLDKLIKLTELFGTRKIDVNGYRNRGCETCDYGSDYGHTIEVLEPTLGLDLPEFDLKLEAEY